jgi:hypothetical protein
MRQRTTVGLGLLLAGMAGWAGAGVVGIGEDDLAIVKKAVASPAPAPRVVRMAPTRDQVVAVAQVTPAPAPAPPARETRPVVRTGREPQWFKVRVVERGTGRKKVTVNLPLSLVRALGDDTIDWGCRGDADGRRQCHTVRLSEVLRSLEAGQELVEVEDEDAVVKVWVE